MIPEGRVLIDTAKSFVYTEGGLKGVLMASRLSGLSPNLTSRFTPGTLISSYEVYEALRRGVAVPFRKRDAEAIRNISEMRASDKGGMIFQPEPGVYEKIHQIDFTSLSFNHCEVQPLARDNRAPGEDRISCKRSILAAEPENRDQAPEEDQQGLQGHRFGPEVDACNVFWLYGLQKRQVRTDSGPREDHRNLQGTLMQIKEMAEEMGYEVLHGIVDCLWVIGGEPISVFKEAVERETGILTEVEPTIGSPSCR